jgi:hypothetical protein
MTLLTRLTLLLFLILPLNALAELPEQLKNEFSPISGIIIMPVGDKYLVDLDASSNLQEGDILTLVMPGEKIIHPVSQKVIGTLDIVKGYLRVTQIKSGYSYATLLTPDITPEKGDQVKRYEQVPVRFETNQHDPQLEEDLKSGLPQLDWLSPGDSVAPLLVFTLAGNNLIIKNSKGRIFKTFPVSNGQLSQPAPVATPTNQSAFATEPEQERSFLNKTVNDLLGSVGLDKKDKRLENPGIIQAQKPIEEGTIWIGPNLKGNPVGITVGDFDNDGQMETAIAMEYELLITRITEGQLQQIASVKFAAGTKLLGIDSIDLDQDGFPEIYLSAASGQILNSQVVEFKNGTYQKTIGQIRWFLRVIDLLGKGKILTGQTLGEYETPFNDLPFLVDRSGNKLNRGDRLAMPKNVNNLSLTPVSGTGSDALYAFITTAGGLQVANSRSKRLWKSSDSFGGSENNFYNTKDINNNEMPDPIFIEPRVLTLPSGEVLAAQNSGALTLRRYHDYTKSRVIALNWNGFSLQELWRTTDQGGYLADLFYADANNDGKKELVMAMQFQRKTILSGGRSTVVIYKLDQ